MQTGVVTNYELNHEVEFPIRICDLTPNTHVGIIIYDMSKQHKESLLASTVIDIFDKKQRMRQGTFNLYLWQNKALDMSVECSTPGLFKETPSMIDNNLAVPSETDKSQENFIEINKLIQKINYYKKKENTDDQKDWIDKTSNEAIFQKLFDLYLNC